MKLTQASIARLPSDKPDAVYYDDDLPGFGIRIRAGGSRNYIVRYRQGGLERRHTVGSVSVLSVEEARKKARKVLVAVDEGRNPTADKATKRASASLLFSSVAADYLNAKQSVMRPRTLVENTQLLPIRTGSLSTAFLGHCEPCHCVEPSSRDCGRSNPTASRARSVLSAADGRSRRWRWRGRATRSTVVAVVSNSSTPNRNSRTVPRTIRTSSWPATLSTPAPDAGAVDQVAGEIDRDAGRADHEPRSRDSPAGRR